MSVYNDDVLLIHIPKAGGTSCRDFMLAHLPGAVDSIGRNGGPLPIDSTPLRHIEEYTKRPLDSWQKIVIPIRDPYEQVVSHWAYHWDRFARGGRHLHDLTGALNHTLTQWLLDPHSDFRLWYELAVRGASAEAVTKLLSSTGFYEYWIALEDGSVPDNVEIVKLESLSQDFPQAIAAWTGGAIGFPHKRSSPHGRDPSVYFTEMAHALVAERFHWTFEKGYYERRAA